jgi:RHS repeat-associated protein
LRASGGADLGGYRYSAFGVTYPEDAGTPGPTVDQPLRWKGRPFLSVGGGVYDMRARWWSPRLGSFLSADDFDSYDVNSTLWGWANQSPTRWSDWTGNGPVGAALGTVIGTIGGASLGLGLGAVEGGVVGVVTGPGEVVAVPVGAVIGLVSGGLAGGDEGRQLGNQWGDAIQEKLTEVIADLSVQDNEYSREAKNRAGSRGDPQAELDKIREELRRNGGLTKEAADKIKTAEKYLGKRNQRKRRDAKGGALFSSRNDDSDDSDECN